MGGLPAVTEAIAKMLHEPQDVHVEDNSNEAIFRSGLFQKFTHELDPSRLTFLYQRLQNAPLFEGLTEQPWDPGGPEAQKLDELRDLSWGRIFDARKRFLALATIGGHLQEGAAIASKGLDPVWKGKAAEKAHEKFDDLGKAAADYNENLAELAGHVMNVWHRTRVPVREGWQQISGNGGPVEVLTRVYADDYLPGLGGDHTTRGEWSKWIDSVNDSSILTDEDGEEKMTLMNHFAGWYMGAVRDFRDFINNAHKAVKSSLEDFRAEAGNAADVSAFQKLKEAGKGPGSQQKPKLPGGPGGAEMPKMPGGPGAGGPGGGAGDVKPPKMPDGAGAGGAGGAGKFDPSDMKPAAAAGGAGKFDPEKTGAGDFKPKEFKPEEYKPGSTKAGEFDPSKFKTPDHASSSFKPGELGGGSKFKPHDLDTGGTKASSFSPSSLKSPDFESSGRSGAGSFNPSATRPSAGDAGFTGASGVGGAGAKGTGTTAGGGRMSGVGGGAGAGASGAGATAGAGGAGAKAPGPGGMGGMMGGAGAGKGGDEDKQHKRKFKYNADPSELFGTDEKAVPPVIGETSYEQGQQGR